MTQNNPPVDQERYDRLQVAAKDHLWMHFTRMATYADSDVPVIVRGQGAYVYDIRGRRYLDALSGLFVNQLGHGRDDLASAAAKQASELAYFPLWSYAHPAAIELAERIAAYAPGDLNRVFFTSGGGESVETAWKLAKNYFKLTGRPLKHKVISRSIAYHGTTQGALSITGLPGLKAVFEPLVPSTFRVPNTNFYRAPIHQEDLEAFGRWAADQIAVAIENEGPETVAAVFLEPVQNAGGCFTPPPGYFQRVREICDQYDVLLVSDEVICAFGRLGRMFGAERYGYQPDIITSAKGLTSGYAPMGAMIASDRLMEPFLQGTNMFAHGYTFGGHPVAAAVALANLDAFENEGVLEHVRANEESFRLTLDKLASLPIVGDIRGAGYFYGIELVKDKVTKETFDEAESERLLRGFLSKALFDAGLYCRADDRGDPVIQLSPPLNCEQSHFDEITEALESVLTEASDSSDRALHHERLRRQIGVTNEVKNHERLSTRRGGAPPGRGHGHRGPGVRVSASRARRSPTCTDRVQGEPGEPMTTTTRTRLRNIAEIRSFLRTNEQPVYFVGPTGFNLLGLDRWVRNFNYVTYYDPWDGRITG